MRVRADIKTLAGGISGRSKMIKENKGPNSALAVMWQDAPYPKAPAKVAVAWRNHIVNLVAHGEGSLGLSSCEDLIQHMESNLQELIKDIRACRLCAGDMARSPNPIFQASASAQILIAGQAPGNLADLSGRPFTDPSGDRLRAWLGLDEAAFYDASKVAIIPMGFCFPGYDKNGSDIPPMTRCASTWRQPLLARLPRIKLTILVGGYAQKWHLGARSQKTLTQTVAKWRNFIDDGICPTPHPSWRNNAWLKRNPWFETDLLPHLQKCVQALL